MRLLISTIQRSWLIILAIFALTSGDGFAQSKGSILELDATKINQLKAELLPNGAWQLETSGKDPWIYTLPLKQGISSESKILSF